MVDAVNTPIIAAGGIGDERGIVAAFVLGAEAAQLGTVFLATHESGASEVHKAELVRDVGPLDRVDARVFWSNGTGIRNRFIEEMSSHEGELPPYPIQNWFTRSIRGAADQAGRAEYLPLWAGQSAALGHRRPAAMTLAALVEGTEQLLRSPMSPLGEGELVICDVGEMEDYGTDWLSAGAHTDRGRIGAATGSRVRHNQLPRAR